MRWHCGLLDDEPERSPIYRLITTRYWNALPPEIEKELEIWLAMPGFSMAFHEKTLHGNRLERTFQARMGHYEKWKAEVIENWLSATREDCVRLSVRRPGLGSVPLLSQLSILDDVKRGLRNTDIAREYRVSGATVTAIGKGRLRFPGNLPPGVGWLVIKN